MSPTFCRLRVIATAAIFMMVCPPRSIRAINPAMTLGVTSFEAGISYRDVQWHAPVGMITNACSRRILLNRRSIGAMELANASQIPTFRGGLSIGKRMERRSWKAAFTFFGMIHTGSRVPARTWQRRRSHCTALGILLEIRKLRRKPR